MKHNSSRGFTLIELLVVIAIIGILASVVLASLNTARNKGADAKIKAQLANARAQAELFYDAGQTYAGVCTTGANNISALVLDSAKASMGNTATVGGNTQAFSYNNATAGGAVCHDAIGGWAAIVSLKTSTTSSGWCVDSTGASKEATALPAVSGTTGYSC